MTRESLIELGKQSTYLVPTVNMLNNLHDRHLFQTGK